MKTITLIALVIISSLIARAQTYEISFAAKGAGLTVDSVIVENLTQGIEESLGGNDILSLTVTIGINEQETDRDHRLLVFPNPMSGACQVIFEMGVSDMANIELIDITGKRIWFSHEKLASGMHSFRIDGLGKGLYILKISADEYLYSSKIISMNPADEQARLRYIGTIDAKMVHNPSSYLINPPGLKNGSSVVEMPYTSGDILKFRGKSGIHGAITMLVPSQSQVVTFLFIKCTDEDDNNYATVQIGSQFWMAENLNVGTRISSYQEQTDNNVIEKYCFENIDENCDTYGTLYQWNEMMQYEDAEGARGICPGGFHVPTQTEWQTMINYLGGESVAGGKLKENGLDHWLSPNTGATDASGFEALPGGWCAPDGTFLGGMTLNASFWTSTQLYSAPWFVNLDHDDAAAGMNDVGKEYGHSVRCIQDNAVELTALAGDTSKSWKLIHDVSTERYPLQVGPYDHTSIWWAAGLNNDEISIRQCQWNDEWIFGRDGTMSYITHGDFWADAGIFEPGYLCSGTDNMINLNGEDCSAWGDGVHQYALETGDDPKLRALGNGAFIGSYRVATDYEVMDLDPMVQDSIRYNLVKLSDGNVDTLIIEADYYFEIGDPYYGGYWRYVLVHYDNPEDEPPIPGNMPEASFSVTSDGLTVTCANTSLYGQQYLWDFGDGTTDTTFNAVHTYAYDDIYNITLTVTNTQGSDLASQEIWISETPLTIELLQGGPWKVRVAEYSIFVGPGMGDNSWWSVPLPCLDGSLIGTTDDWSCLPDDEFTFGSGGAFTYQAFGDVRNDGYFGVPNGCWDESALEGNGLYFASGTHSYAFTPASGEERPIITLTNGAGRAAFIGFYKGYYGGENSNEANPPNGGFNTNTYEVMGFIQAPDKDYLFISVDITSDHSGSAAWSAILERD